MDEYGRANRANWDDRAPVHRGSHMRDVASFVADPGRLTGGVAFDAARLVRHLPPGGFSCTSFLGHFRMETLSWARPGRLRHRS